MYVEDDGGKGGQLEGEAFELYEFLPARSANSLAPVVCRVAVARELDW